MSPQKTHLPTYEGCLVCGQKSVNPYTLHLRFRTTENGVEADFTPQVMHEGYRRIVHGGILCAVLDETLGSAVAVARKKYFVTGELTVRFTRPLMVGTPVVVRGRPVEHNYRHSVAEGEVADAEGNIYARATGKFFVMPDERAREVRGYLTFQNDDLDVLAD
jgi:uncharacterized protein (TIGR00369 family)